MNKGRKIFISLLAILVISFLTYIFITEQSHETRVTGNVIDFRSAGEQVNDAGEKGEESSGNKITGESQQVESKTPPKETPVIQDGFPHFIFYDSTEKSFKIAQCQDDDCLNPVYKTLVDSVPAGENLLWDIASGKDNFLTLVYLDENLNEYILVDCKDYSCSSISKSSIKTTSADYIKNHLAVELLSSGKMAVITQSFGTYETTPNVKGIYSTLLVCENANCDSNYEINLGPPYKKENVDITLNEEENPVISFVKNKEGSKDDQIFVMICGNSDCSKGNSQMLLANVPSDSIDSIRDTKVFVGEDGTPIVFYSSLSEIWMVKCKDDLCSSFERELISDESNSWDAFIGTDNLPIISYSSLRGIAIVHCDNSDCSEKTKSVVSFYSSGTNNALSIGKDGYPTISYYNEEKKSLMVAHCGNFDCSQENLIKTLASTGDVGKYSRGMVF